ncbi:hypothetical protein H640_00010, partial [Cutibacterium granulosum TM11]
MSSGGPAKAVAVVPMSAIEAVTARKVARSLFILMMDLLKMDLSCVVVRIRVVLIQLSKERTLWALDVEGPQQKWVGIRGPETDVDGVKGSADEGLV